MTTYAAPRTQLLVALHGRSLMLTGIARRLARHSHLDVVQVDGPTPADALGSLLPDALVLDLGSVPIDSALALLRDRPELILVGLEATGARLLVLSGDRARAISTRGLVALIGGKRQPEDEPMTQALPGPRDPTSRDLRQPEAATRQPDRQGGAR